MKYLTSLLPLLLLVSPALSDPSDSSCSAPESLQDLTDDLSHTEWLLSKTHRMVLRAKQHGRKDKVKVFEKREKNLKREIKELKEEIEELEEDGEGTMSIQPVPSTTAAASSKKTTSTTKKASRPTQTLTATVKPAPILAVTSQTSSSRTSASPSSTPVSAISSTQKKGLGFERLLDLEPLSQSSSSVSWCYNWNSRLFEWDTNPDASVPAGVEFVPMLWKPDDDHLKTFEKNVEFWRKQEGGLTHILGFNEPDLKGQAEMTLKDTLDGWQDHLEPFAKGSSPLKLVSPAVTNGPAPMGLTFLDGFMQGVKERGLTVDAIALHWYDSPTNFEYFKNHLTEAHEKHGLPIWLTEYGFNTGTEQEKIDFHKKMVPWLNEQSWIERYAAFGDFVGTFVDGNGGVLPLGNAYASA